jgi:hypothetical protein
MARKAENNQQGVLANHQRKGKLFVPPFIAQLGPLNEVSWINRILPEILWIALLQRVLGLAKGVQLAQILAKEAMAIRPGPGVFGSTSSLYRLSSDEFTELRHRLAANGSLFELQEGLSALVNLYPECPLLHLFTSISDDPRHLSLIKSIVTKLYDRADREAVLAQSTFIYLAFDAGILHVREGLSLADFPCVEDYPDTERSQQVASSVRAAISMFFGEPFYDASSTWPAYFWNRGLDLESCSFPYVGEDSNGREPSTNP